MLTLEVPEFVRVRVCVCRVPTGTFPNVALLGVSVSCPGGIADPVPFPAKFNIVVALEASLVIVVVAVNEATALGVNEMLIDVLCPAATVRGRFIGAKEKY